MGDGSGSFGPRGLTIEQQNEIAAIQSQAASQSMQSNTQRFSVRKGETALYVGELSPNVNDDILKQHFNNAKSVHVCRDHVSGKSLGYAYVNFVRPEDCLRALEKMNYSSINGRPCRLMLSERDPSRRVTGSGNIFVKNLPATVDDKSFFDTFSQWGNVLSCKVIRNPNATRCYGYVNYDSIGAAERAIELVNGTILFGREIQVGHQIPKSERENNQEEVKQKFTNLYVKNIALDVTEEELKKLFESCGKVSSIVIQKDEHNNSKGFGFVNFETFEEAEAAIQQFHDLDYFDKKLFVSKAQKKSEREDELRRQHSPLVNNTLINSPPLPAQKYQGVNLYIKNLSDQVTDDILRKEFSKFGQITSAKVMKDEYNVSKGFGFVCFTSPENATEAVLKMNGYKLFNKEIYVALAQRKEDRRQLLAVNSPPPSTVSKALQPTVEAATSAIPNQLTLDTLKSFSEETQRQMLGERIYALVSESYPEECGKLTGMLLELDKAQLIQLINNPSQLQETSKGALKVLREHLSSAS